jgi:thiamine-phosphate pyrophosphorylase
MNLPRLYPILDTATLERRAFPVETAAAAMLEGGAGILQFRHKGPFTRKAFEDAGRVADLCRRFGAQFVVDDRADIAVLLNAGLHLGQEDLAPEDARRLIGTKRILGFSTHDAAQLSAAAAVPADYLALGPIFETASKENAGAAVGLANLRAWRRLTARPLAAIGGINRQNAAAVLEAGADSVAVISDLLPDEITAASLRTRMEEWQRILKNVRPA